MQNVRFLVGFLLSQLVMNPSVLLSKVCEWCRRKGKRRLRKLLDFISSFCREDALISNGRYTEFLDLYTVLSPWKKLRNLGNICYARNELFYLSAAPVERSKRTRRGGKQTLSVLFIATNALPYTQSGYTIRTHETAKALAQRGVNVQVVTRYGYPLVIGEKPSRQGRLVDGIRYWDVVPRGFHFRVEEQLAFAVERTAEIAESIQADLVVTTTDFHNAIVAQRVAATIGVPWVYEIRGEQEKTWLTRLPKSMRLEAKKSDKYRLVQKQETNFANDADAVITIGSTLSAAVKQRGVAGSKITEIPNAIDDSIFNSLISKHEARQRCGLPDETFIGYVGSVVRYEGLDMLLRMAELDDNLRVLVVGDGEDLSRLKRLSETLGVEERVYLVGKKPVDEISMWYACLDVFVVPREDWEVCRTVPPLKPLNAMALGIPILASDLPALKYITGNLGVYVEGRKPSLYLRMLDSLLACQPDPLTLKAWARKHTWSRNAAEYSSIFERLT